MTSLKGNPEKQRQRNLHAKALNEKRTKEYRQKVIPNKKHPREKLRPKDIHKLLEIEE